MFKKIIYRAVLRMFRGMLFDDCMRWDLIAIAVSCQDAEQSLKYTMIIPVDYELSLRQ